VVSTGLKELKTKHFLFWRTLLRKAALQTKSISVIIAAPPDFEPGVGKEADVELLARVVWD
jgi:hypothetical protein